MIKCKCCGDLTVEEEFDVCPVCGWEKDRVQEKFVGMAGGANEMCLAEARDNFRRYGSCEEKNNYTAKRTHSSE